MGMSAMSSTGLGDTSGIGQEGEEATETPAPMQAPKKSRTNTPWTPAEEQRLKVMRDAGNSWGEIAKVDACSAAITGPLADVIQRPFLIGQKEV